MTRCWFVELSRATYYRWTGGSMSQRLVEDAYLANEIVDISTYVSGFREFGGVGLNERYAN